MSVKNDFARTAFDSEKPCSLGERCTVFMERDINTFLGRDYDKREILAAAAHSVMCAGDDEGRQ